MVAKPVLVRMIYKGSDDNDAIEMVLAYNESGNKNYILVSTSESDDEAKKTFLRDKLKMKSKSPPDHTQSKSGTNNEKNASFVKWQ